MNIVGYLKSLQLWIRSRPSEREYIFVIGAPRSGTSLLKNLLITHSKLCGTDYESTGLIRIRNFWAFELDELKRNNFMTLLSSSQSLPSLYDNLADALLQQKNGEKFVDKFAIREWRLRYLRKYFPNAKYINIVRDGRDSYCSAIHAKIQQSKSVRNYARYWKKCVELPIEIIPSGNIFTFRYEDLVDNPEPLLSEVMAFTGYLFEASQIDVREYSKVSTLRFDEGHKNLGKSITAKSKNRWRKEMSQAGKDIFWKIAGSSLERMEYLP